MAAFRIAKAAVFFVAAASGQSTDGGRSDLPGMKKDIFDEIKRSKQGGGAKNKPKERQECPKSDGLSPFTAMYISKDDIYVKLAGDHDKCEKLVNVGGANISSLWAASKTCGSVGEWKRRVAEELSAIFFVGGYESWPKSENETIEVETEFGNYSAPVLASNYDTIKYCWARGCHCEQASSPVMRAFLLGGLMICLAGIGKDAFSFLLGKKDKEQEKKDKKERKSMRKSQKEADGSDSEAKDKKDKKDKKSKSEDGSDSEKKDKKEKKEKKERKSKAQSEDGSDSEKRSGKDDTEASEKEDGASEKSKEDDAKEEKAQ